jgi:hypothetical protein
MLPVEFILHRKDSLGMAVGIIAKLKPEESYQLIIDSAACCDIYGACNNKLETKLTLKSLDEYSTLKVQMKHFDPRARIQLLNDKDTRQALIFISTPSVQFDGNKDFICTLNYVFNIDEENKLHLTVNRRSQDLFFGLPYDYAFEFLLLYKMYNELKDLYPELEIGSYTMFCNNTHIYDRNKETFEKMLNDYKNNDIVIDNIIDKVDQNIIKNYVLNKNFGN